MQTRAVKLLRKHEAAAYLGIKWRKLDYMREHRQIPFVKIGKLVLFLQTDLDGYIQKHRFSAQEGGER
jgi:excisionase family DNA binding protein